MSKRDDMLLAAGVLGTAVSGYAYLYQSRRIDEVYCPGFGEGCSVVLRSKYAYPLGIPDAIFGVLGYGLAARSGRSGRQRQERGPHPAVPTGRLSLSQLWESNYVVCQEGGTPRRPPPPHPPAAGAANPASGHSR